MPNYGSYQALQAQATVDEMVRRGVGIGGSGGGGTSSLYDRVISASDAVKTFNYLDAGTADERIITIIYSSASLNTAFTDTYTYGGSPGNYRITKIVRS